MAEPLSDEALAEIRGAFGTQRGLLFDRLLATVDLWERRANENSDIIHKLRGRLDIAEAVITNALWLAQQCIRRSASKKLCRLVVVNARWESLVEALEAVDWMP